MDENIICAPKIREFFFALLKCSIFQYFYGIYCIAKSAIAKSEGKPITNAL